MINYYVVCVRGKNPKRFLMKLFKLGIEVLDVKYFSDRVLFKVSYSDYAKILDIKTIYDISIVNTMGINLFKLFIKKYKIFLIFFVIGIFLIIFFTKFIFFININTDNSELRSLILKELKNNGVTLYSYGNNYSFYNGLKSNIINSNRDKISWIEIEKNGVLLSVDVIEKVSNNYSKKFSSFKDIVASKNGYIREIYASSGEILKNKDDYVKKGDIIVSGKIYRNEKVVGRVKANAIVYAEVWYRVTSSMNINNKEEYYDDSGIVSYNIVLFNKSFCLFKINKKITSPSVSRLFHSDIFDIVKEKKNKILYRNVKYNKNEMEDIMLSSVESKINSMLDDKEYIISKKTLNNTVKNGKMFIEVFVRTYENIAMERNLLKDIKKDTDS